MIYIPVYRKVYYKYYDFINIDLLIPKIKIGTVTHQDPVFEKRFEMNFSFSTWFNYCKANDYWALQVCIFGFGFSIFRQYGY
jgi:hypothetical protein